MFAVKACFAVLALAVVAPSVEGRWTGNVMVVNLMTNKSLDFLVSWPARRFAAPALLAARR